MTFEEWWVEGERDALVTFEEWWVEQVGHPPADEKERYAFEMAKRAWDHMGHLLRQTIPHVYRQQHHGRHAQDREDAKELLPQLERATTP